MIAEVEVLLEEHFEAIHGDFNCELGICGQSLSSKFIPYAFKKHLIKGHEIKSSEAVGLVDALVKAGECALTDSQLVRLGWIEGQRGLQTNSTTKIFMESWNVFHGQVQWEEKLARACEGKGSCRVSLLIFSHVVGVECFTLISLIPYCLVIGANRHSLLCSLFLSVT